MTILFAGGEMGAFVPSDSNAVEITSYYDSGFARTGLTANGSTTFNESAEFAETADVWIHLELAQHGSTGGSSTKRPLIVMVDGSDLEVFQVTADYGTVNGSTNWQLQYKLAGVWTNVGTSFATAGTLQTIDIHLTADSASGVFDIYFSGTKRSENAVDFSAIGGVAKIRSYGANRVGGDNTTISQCVVSTESTIGGRLMTVAVSSAGSTAQWTGAYTGVDEVAYSDSDFMFSDTANQVQLFAGTPVNALTGYSVAAVVVTARANTSGTGPTQIQGAVKSGSTTYFSSSSTLDAGYGAFCWIWETDPATTLDWTVTDAAAIQFGVKSIA
jgi:hypothetical protein